MKKIMKFLISRGFIFGICILAQFSIFASSILFLSNFGYWMYGLFTWLSLITILVIISKNDNPMYKIAWIVPVALLPILGWFIYFLMGRGHISKRRIKKMEFVESNTKYLQDVDNELIAEIAEQSKQIANQIKYISNTSDFAVCKNTQTQYLSPGERFFDVLCEELKKAEKFIFMEYFIIEEGKMWNTILEILIERANDGVEVNLMYDDIGCMNTLPYGYAKKMQELGINTQIFNVLTPKLDVFMNYRDHRKITVIDGKVGFVGGNNLADEYINEVERFGHWRDSTLMIKGDAVWNLSVMFLHMWQYYKKDVIDYDRYRQTENEQNLDCTTVDDNTDNGYVLPFCDGPLDDYLIGEMAYINMINNAVDYISITTPYLIIDNEMITALCNASISGVDVSIITPGIPDKWYVHIISRYNYKRLIENGVKIYEYKLGFVHSKTIACDDEVAIVGTQNFDFRSFYLHYECGAYMYKTKAVEEVRADHVDLMCKSNLITRELAIEKNIFKRLTAFVLNLFAPLL